MRGFFWQSSLLCGLLALTGARASSEEPKPATAALTEKELLAFAAKLEAAARSEGGKELDQYVDLDALMATALKGTPGTDEDRKNYADSLKKGFSLGEMIDEVAKHSGSFKFLRLRWVDTQPILLFRLASQSGVNYHDYYIAPSAGGPKIVNLMPHLMGETASKTFRRQYLVQLAAHTPDEKHEGWEIEFAASVVVEQTQRKMEEAATPEDALQVFNELPPALQLDKSLQIVRLTSAARVGGPEFEKAVADFQKNYPTDPGVDLLLLDAFSAKRDYSHAHEALDRIEKRLGGDPYLLFRRGLLYLMAENLPEAKKWAAQATEAEAGLADPYWMLVAIGLKEKNYADVVKWLKALETRAKAPLPDFTQLKHYADFVASPEYAEWMKGRGK